MRFRVLYVFFMSLIFTLFIAINTFASTNSFSYNGVNINIDSKDISAHVNNTDGSGSIPNIDYDSDFSATINAMINNIYNNGVSTASGNRAKQVVFDYKIFNNSDNYVSILITSKTVNATEKLM